jgi:hypothetical protein
VRSKTCNFASAVVGPLLGQSTFSASSKHTLVERDERRGKGVDGVALTKIVHVDPCTWSSQHTLVKHVVVVYEHTLLKSYASYRREVGLLVVYLLVVLRANVVVVADDEDVRSSFVMLL